MSDVDSPTERWSGRQATWVALLVCAILSTALLHRGLLPGRTLVPLDLIQTIVPWDKLEIGPLENPLISDPFYSFYPRRAILTEAIQSGELPLWNPSILTGTPEIANPNFQLFYPPNLLAALFMAPATALVWLAWVHLTLTGFLMFLFLRRHRLVWVASLLGGAVWLLNGYTVVWLENPHRLSTSAWIPGLFWAYEMAISGQRNRGISVGALCLGMAILGGQMQFILAVGLVFGLYGVIRWWQKRGDLNRLWAPAGIGLLGIALGAISIIPASQLAVASQRIRFDSNTILTTSWHFDNLIRLLIPDYFGNPVDGVGFWGQANYVETLAYFGAVALLLALLTLMIRPLSQLAIAGLLGMALALALTLGTPLARLIPLLPGGQFIALSRLLILLSLCGSWLAAAGLDGWLRQQGKWSSSSRLWRLGIPAGTLLIVAAAASFLQSGPQSGYVLAQSGRAAAIIVLASIALWRVATSPWFLVGLMLIVVLDLWQWGYDFNPIGDTANLYPETEIVSMLREDGSLFRVQPLQSGKVVYGPNVVGLYGFAEAGGYTPLIGSNYERLMRTIEPNVAIEFLRGNRNMLLVSHPNPLLGLLNVKYFLAADQLDEGFWSSGDSFACNYELILGDEPVTYDFVVPDAGLNRLDLGIARQAGTGQLQVILEQAGRKVVAQYDQPLADIAQDGALPFFFAPVAGSAGQPFSLTLRASAEADVRICTDEAGEPSIQLYGSALRFITVTGNGVWLYENLLAQPRAFVVHHVVVVDDVIGTVAEPGHDWHNSVVLDAPLPTTLLAEPLPTMATATIEQYDRQRVKLSVATPESGLLVLADSFAPGWVAILNGEETPIYAANGVQRGVLVPAGSHQIEFRYRPVALYQGGAVSLVALLIIATLFIKKSNWSMQNDQYKSENLTAGER